MQITYVNVRWITKTRHLKRILVFSGFQLTTTCHNVTLHSSYNVAAFFFDNFMLHLNVYCMYKTRAMYTYNVCVCIFVHHTAVTRMAVSTTTMAAQTTPTGTATASTNCPLVTT